MKMEFNVIYMLTSLQKNGIRIWLSEDGWVEFVRLIEEESKEATKAAKLKEEQTA